MFNILILLHILSATIWTGGHLILAATVLPKVLKNKDIEGLLNFENGYEKIGIPALFIQIITGILLALRMVPQISLWFDFGNPVARLIGIKLILLLITAILAIDSRLRIIPNLSEKNLNSLAVHIIAVTTISILFIIVGFSFRTGMLYF